MLTKRFTCRRISVNNDKAGGQEEEHSAQHLNECGREERILQRLEGERIVVHLKEQEDTFR